MMQIYITFIHTQSFT